MSEDYTPLQYPATHSLETPADSTVQCLVLAALASFLYLAFFILLGSFYP